MWACLPCRLAGWHGMRPERGVHEAACTPVLPEGRGLFAGEPEALISSREDREPNGTTSVQASPGKDGPREPLCRRQAVCQTDTTTLHEPRALFVRESVGRRSGLSPTWPLPSSQTNRPYDRESLVGLADRLKTNPTEKKREGLHFNRY